VETNYGAFPKFEPQQTETDHDDKHTSMNDVKERQISGPGDYKKVMANPFVHAVEGMMHEHVPTYCGRKNWMEICADLEEASDDIPNLIWAAADGSGFDMTQLPCHNRLMNDLFIKILNLPNVQLDPRLSKETIVQILQDSLYLSVSVDFGCLKYKAQGRASGDGWTTCGNTILMQSYWLYAFYLANVPKHMYCLRVKGDDVIFGLNARYRPEVEKTIDRLFTRTKESQKYGLGQICKKVDWGCITDIDFLSCHFFFTGKGRLRMTRIPSRVLQSICYSIKYKQSDKPEVALELAYSKGSCLKAWARGLPIFEVLADKMMELGRPGGRSDYDHYADWGRVWLPKDDRVAYLDYLHQRYGVTEDMVNRIESGIKSLTSFHKLVEIPDLMFLA